MSYRKKLPIGVDNFEKLIQEDFFYVDKTGMIAELLKNWSEVNLFTRPRRCIDLANGRTKDEIERLIGGEMILKEINQELTYGELDACPDSYADYHTAEGNL